MSEARAVSSELATARSQPLSAAFLQSLRGRPRSFGKASERAEGRPQGCPEWGLLARTRSRTAPVTGYISGFLGLAPSWKQGHTLGKLSVY